TSGWRSARGRSGGAPRSTRRGAPCGGGGAPTGPAGGCPPGRWDPGRLGVLLSGGVSAGLIVALLAEQGQRGLATFSIGFPDAGGREGNEFRYSDLIAERFGTDHHQIRVGTAALV